jgi:hypothetical protein
MMRDDIAGLCSAAKPLYLFAVTLAGLWLSGSIASAEGVTVEGDKPSENIALMVENQSIESVLTTLSERFGIKIYGLQKNETNEIISISLNGPLPIIMQRLLRNRNYVIVRSQANIAGIEKIVLFPASAPKTPPPAPPASHE